MSQSINYGILGLGNIAHKFVHDLLLSRSSNLYAVASRNLEKANQFREKYAAQKAYGDYDALLEDSGVDIIYIATPHSFHYQQILNCLEHGKHVLCEKPICLNADQVEQVREKQKATGLFVMEALWTKFIPAYQELKRQIKMHSHQILSLFADFAFPADKDPQGRCYNPHLAGGSLLDIGIYPAFLALDILGHPQKIIAQGKVENGVDSRTSATLLYDDGRLGQIYSDFETVTHMNALLRTERGVYILPEQWHNLDHFYFKNSDDRKTFKSLRTGIGYYHEIEHVNECLLEGKTQSPTYPLIRSLSLIQMLDDIRQQIGLHYPPSIEAVQN